MQGQQMLALAKVGNAAECYAGRKNSARLISWQVSCSLCSMRSLQYRKKKRVTQKYLSSKVYTKKATTLFLWIYDMLSQSSSSSLICF